MQVRMHLEARAQAHIGKLKLLSQRQNPRDWLRGRLYGKPAIQPGIAEEGKGKLPCRKIELLFSMVFGYRGEDLRDR